jgi:hypothetical protein
LQDKTGEIHRLSKGKIQEINDKFKEIEKLGTDHVKVGSAYQTSESERRMGNVKGNGTDEDYTMQQYEERSDLYANQVREAN